MMRTKVRTSDGEVIWVDRGGRVKSSPKPTDQCQSKDPEHHCPLQSPEQQLVDMADNEMEITTTEPTIEEELLEEEIIDPEPEEEDDSNQHETVVTAWPLNHDNAVEEKTEDIRCKLAKWSHDHNISDAAIDDLLALLKQHNFPDLPDSSARLKCYYSTFPEVEQTVADSPKRLNVSEIQLEDLQRNQRKMANRQDVMNDRLTRIENILFTTHSNTSGKRFTWPIDSPDTLQNYEIRLKNGDKGLKEDLRQKFATANQKSLEIFITENVRTLLGSIGRWTWTGIPSNCLHGSEAQIPPTGAAKRLLCVQVLIDYCVELFSESYPNVITEIKKAFKRVNEAKKKYVQRLVKKHNAPNKHQQKKCEEEQNSE